MRLDELATALGATLRPGSSGDLPSTLEITGVAALESAGPTEISFLDNPRYVAAARTTQAAAVLIGLDADPLPSATLQVKDPYRAFALAVELFYQAPRYAPGIHPTATIDPSAQLPDDVHVGPYVVVSARVRVGPGSVLLAHAVLYEDVTAGARLFAHSHAVVREHCTLGDDVTLGNGAVIGSDGFGFARDGKGGWHKIPQSGRVLIGNGVEVQANSCVDRGSIGYTTIADGVKIDNLVQVGHGSSVGSHTLLCAQVGLAGSTRVGRGVILAGQVGVAGHLGVGDGAVATAQSGIPNDVPPGLTVSGYPAMENGRWLRASAAFGRLPELLRRVAKLERAAAKDVD